MACKDTTKDFLMIGLHEDFVVSLSLFIMVIVEITLVLLRMRFHGVRYVG